MREHTKGYIDSLLATATWETGKAILGGSLVTSLGVAIWEYLRHKSVDWWGILGLFLMTSALFWLARKRQTKEGGKELLSRELSLPPEMTEEERQSIAYQNKLIELGRSIDGVLNPLQIDALNLSSDLLAYLKEIGPPPTPKYTAQDINGMPTEEMRELLQAGDIDFAEACEYHKLGTAQTAPAIYNQIIGKWKRMYPWYQKMEAGYALRFKDRVEKLRHRFMLEGLTDDAFTLPIEYRDGIKNVRMVASAFWELAYRITEKDSL